MAEYIFVASILRNEVIPVTEEALKKVYAIYTDCWKLYKKHCNPVNTCEFWSTVMEDMRTITTDHGNSQLCIDLLSATLSELEKIALQESS